MENFLKSLQPEKPSIKRDGYGLYSLVNLTEADLLFLRELLSECEFKHDYIEEGSVEIVADFRKSVKTSKEYIPIYEAFSLNQKASFRSIKIGAVKQEYEQKAKPKPKQSQKKKP